MSRDLKKTRQIAVKRFFKGEGSIAICASIGKSRFWLYCIKRFDPNDPTWCYDCSRCPLRSPVRTPKDIEPSGRPNQNHQADLMGPRFLRGPIRFYSQNVIDISTNRSAVEPLPRKGSHNIINEFWAIWLRLGIPENLQVDNALSYYCSHRDTPMAWARIDPLMPSSQNPAMGHPNNCTLEKRCDREV